MIIILPSIAVGSVLHKGIIFLTLEAGMPAEGFRLISAVFFIFLFFIVKVSGVDFLRRLRWS